MGSRSFSRTPRSTLPRAAGWHVWERDNISGQRRQALRAALGVETLLAVAPNRFLDLVRFERNAQALRLDPALRFRAAEEAAAGEGASGIHALEREFALPSEEILDIIRERPRLGMAVRGGVAERHLHKVLEGDPDVAGIGLGQAEGPPDFFVRLTSRRRRVSVECKNASPKTYADGTPKVETQKTRASKGDPKSRLYDPIQFEVVAACMYGPLGRWEFRYKRSTGSSATRRSRIESLRSSESTTAGRQLSRRRWPLR